MVAVNWKDNVGDYEAISSSMKAYSCIRVRVIKRLYRVAQKRATLIISCYALHAADCVTFSSSIKLLRHVGRWPCSDNNQFSTQQFNIDWQWKLVSGWTARRQTWTTARAANMTHWRIDAFCRRVWCLTLCRKYLIQWVLVCCTLVVYGRSTRWTLFEVFNWKNTCLSFHAVDHGNATTIRLGTL